MNDLDFLKELQYRVRNGFERQDHSQIEYAQKMIADWIDELKDA